MPLEMPMGSAYLLKMSGKLLCFQKLQWSKRRFTSRNAYGGVYKPLKMGSRIVYLQKSVNGAVLSIPRNAQRAFLPLEMHMSRAYTLKMRRKLAYC